jgi:hypothetical protein
MLYLYWKFVQVYGIAYPNGGIIFFIIIYLSAIGF